MRTLCYGLAVTVAAWVVTGVVHFHPSIESQGSAEKSLSYRNIDEAFAIHRKLGWTMISAPNDGRRYRICGAIANNDPKSDASHMSGSFATGGKSVTFSIRRPPDVEVAVEGLEPADRGDLQFAVLTRPFVQKKVR